MFPITSYPFSFVYIYQHYVNVFQTFWAIMFYYVLLTSGDFRSINMNIYNNSYGRWRLSAYCAFHYIQHIFWDWFRLFYFIFCVGVFVVCWRPRILTTACVCPKHKTSIDRTSCRRHHRCVVMFRTVLERCRWASRYAE